MKTRTSICVAMFCALLLLTGLSTSAGAGQISASTYAMYNGGTSSPGSSLRDDSYGSADSAIAYAWLSGSKGDLTDGITSPSNWDSNPGPYVGWSDGVFQNPQITFYFAGISDINQVGIYFNWLYSPSSVDFTMGSTTRNVTVNKPNPASGANYWYYFNNLNLNGNTLIVTLRDDTSAWNTDWIMIQEVTFDGSSQVPEPATMLLFGLGLVGLVGVRRYKK